MNQDTIKNKRYSFIFIRHGQSIHNEKAQKLRQKYGLQSQLTQQYKEMKYMPDLLDGGLTQKGKQQALSAKQLIKNQNIDIVFVSPLKRALQTCDIIFADQKDLKVYVEPLMCEYIASAVCIGGRIKQSYELYGKKFNFQNLDAQQIKQQNWYLNILKDQKIKQLIRQKVLKENLSYPLASLQIVKQTPLQTLQEVRKRAKEFKKILQKYSTSTKNKICIVGHGMFFRILLQTKFNIYTGQPQSIKQVKNCLPQYVEMDVDVQQ